MQKPASELNVGDVFCRGPDGPSPRTDATYTVQRLQRVPVHDFFGKIMETIQVSAVNHLLGPATLTLGSDEPVWILGRAGAGGSPQPQPPPPPDSRWNRWRRR